MRGSYDMVQLIIAKKLTKTDWMKARDGNADDSPIMRLYQRLDALYPIVWAKHFNTDQKRTNFAQHWSDKFIELGFDYQHIKRGLDNVVMMYPDFPPTLGQFIKCCITTTAEESRLQTINNINKFDSDIKNRATPEEVAQHIENIKEILRKGGNGNIAEFFQIEKLAGTEEKASHVA